MSARLSGIARDTEEIVTRGVYRAADGREVSIAQAVAAARAGTRLYGPDPVEPPHAVPVLTLIEVTGESSLEAARRLVRDDGPPVAVVKLTASPSSAGKPCAGSVPRCGPGSCTTAPA